MAATMRSFVPAQSRWITLLPGTGRSSTIGLRCRRFAAGARHDLPPVAVGIAASTPS